MVETAKYPADNQIKTDVCIAGHLKGRYPTYTLVAKHLNTLYIYRTHKE